MPPTDQSGRDPYDETLDASRIGLVVAAPTEASTPGKPRPSTPGDDDTVASLASNGATPEPLTPIQRFRPRSSVSEEAYLQTEASISQPASAVVSLPPRFELRKSLGAGGMGEVVLAHDRVLGRDVAIKVLRHTDNGDTDTRARLLDEAQSAAQIRHPNIVNIHDVDLDRGLIVMEFLEQGSMRKVIDERGKLPIKEVLRIAAQLCAALEAAHGAGLVHRDIKPDNVLLDHDGSVKIADFGVAQSRRRTSSGHSEIVGTPAYMAPEQLRGAVCDARADLYALGLTLYELAVGKRFHTPDGPADGSVAGLSKAVKSGGLAEVLSRCLAEDPAHRFMSARELGEAIEAITKRRQRLRFAGAAALMITAITLPLVLYLTKQPEATPAALLRVAVVPFENPSGDASLDWLRQGFANLVSSALRRRNVPAVRHSRLRDLAGHGAATQMWVDAAKQAGANELVSGRFVRDGTELAVTVSFREQHYSVRGKAARADTIADELASQIAKTLVGEEATPHRRGRSPEAMRAFELGYASLQQHEFPRAIEHLRDALRRDPDYVDARYALITALLSYPSTTVNLVQEVDHALARNLSARERPLFEALKLRVQRRYDEAAALYDRLRGQYPSEKEAHYGLADSLFHLGRADQAMAAFKQLVRIAPGFHLAYQHPIEYYGARGQWREINAYLYFLRRASPPHQFLVGMEMRLEVAKKNYARALERQKGIANPRAELLEQTAAVHALRGDLDAAREAYAQASAQTPENWELRIDRAALDLTQGHLADFQSDVAWETAGNESLSAVANRLATRGLLYAILGRPDDAKRDLDEVQATVSAEVQRRMPRVAYLEGTWALLAKDPERPDEAARRLITGPGREMPSRAIEVRGFLAAIGLANRGVPAIALKKLAEAYKVREDGFYAPVILMAMARIAYASGDRAVAAARCQELLQPTSYSPLRSPAVPVCLGILAKIRDAEGKKDEARKYARALVELWKFSAVELPELAWARALVAE